MNIETGLWSKQLLSFDDANLAKCGEDIHISLSDFAVALLIGQQGRHPEHAFTYAGKPIKYVNTKAWRGALERAGV